jgi:phosphatidate cytidylyltransferase
VSQGGELRTRLLVAGLGIPVCVAVVWVGGLVFAAGLAILAAVGMGEYVAMFRTRAGRIGDATGLPFRVLGVLSAACLPLVAYTLGLAATWAAVPILLLAAGAYALATRPPERGPITAAALTVFGAVYLGGLLAFAVPLRQAQHLDRAAATLLFFLPVVVTWLADTAAYFGGRSWGRRKLAPLVSPNKTVAGAVSAVVAGPAVALAYGAFLAPLGGLRLDPVLTVLFGLAAAVAGIIGDLVESLVKRECGVKDASHILPGHGGILDRLDSLLWVFPVAFLFFVAS